MVQSRRTLLRSTGGMLATGAVLAVGSCTPTLAPAATASPDAELIQLCAEFHRLHADTRSLPDTGGYTWEDAIEARWEVSNEIENIHPATAGGHRAKATIALVLMEEQHGDSGDADIRFTLGTFRDLLERAPA